MAERPILLAWELGANLGHAAALCRLAQAIEAHGGATAIAARRPAAVAQLGGAAHRVLRQAPHRRPTARSGRRRLGMAEVLGDHSLGDPDALADQLQAWRALIAELRPRAVVVDSAPAALVAAQAMDLPTYSLSTGYGLPPPTTPLPAARWWTAQDPDAVAAREAQVLGAVQAGAGRVGLASPPSLGALYGALQGAWLRVPPWLDHFGPLRGAPVPWVAFAPRPGHLERPSWRGDGRPRVFAYVRRRNRASQAVARALDRPGLDAVLFAPDLPPASLPSDRVRIVRQPVDLGWAATQAQLAICHSAAGTGLTFIAHGVPCVLVPGHLEQEGTARGAELAGRAVVVPRGHATASSVGRAIDAAMAHSPGLRPDVPVATPGEQALSAVVEVICGV